MLALTLLLLASPQQLIGACRAGNLPAARALLAAGADPDSATSRGETALIYAAVQNRADLAALLLDYGARVNATWVGSTALDFAVSTGSLETARLLIDNGADVRRVYPSGRTTLHLAARNRSAAMAALLIDRGAAIDAQDGSGATPLLEAVERRYDDLTALLLEAGADPLLKNKAGVSPLECAAGQHRPAIVRTMVAGIQHPPPDLLSEAVRKNYPEIVEALLAAGINGSPALHDAALQGRIAMLKLLLAKGADVNFRNATGATPLHDAAIAGSVEAVRFLLDNGAAINAREGETGDTPLYMAAAMGREETVALLLEKGADPAIAGKDGSTPLHAAVVNGFTGIAQAIRAHTAK